jgi:hypothetical protein
MEDTFSRRSKMYLWTPAELSIFNSIQEVEKSGYDIRLTQAIALLDKARNLVADYVEEQEAAKTAL